MPTVASSPAAAEESLPMSQQTDFLLERVVQEEKLAKAASLANVRNNHLRAAEAWRQLAERSVRGDVLRAKEAERKAERDALAAQERADAFRDSRD